MDALGQANISAREPRMRAHTAGARVLQELGDTEALQPFENRPCFVAAVPAITFLHCVTRLRVPIHDKAELAPDCLLPL